MGDSLLSIENLQVSFSTENGVAEVLDGVNFSIKSGEIVGLVGESGCGKTTLARSILGILPKNSAKIFSGSITFNGQNLLEMQEQDIARDIRGRLITFIPQDPFSSFNPVFTIGVQIMDLMKWKYGHQERRGFFGGVRKPEREKHFNKVVELLQTVQLPDAEGVLENIHTKYQEASVSADDCYGAFVRTTFNNCRRTHDCTRRNNSGPNFKVVTATRQRTRCCRSLHNA